MKAAPLCLVGVFLGCASSDDAMLTKTSSDGGDASIDAPAADAGVTVSDAQSDTPSETSSVCVPDAATCDGSVSPCDDTGLLDQSLGCEHYAIPTASSVADSFEFGIVVTNPTGVDVSVKIEGGELFAPLEKKIDGYASLEIPLPWVPELKGMSCIGTGSETQCGPMSGGSVRVLGGAYRVRSSQPVRVLSMNPLKHQSANGSSVLSSEAALLAPTRSLGSSHRVVSRPAWTSPLGGAPNPGFIAVAAIAATSVTFEPTAKVRAGTSVPEIAAGESYTTTLGPGEVIELFSYDGDLTGSLVSSDQPVVVVSGHYCASPSSDPSGFCQHLEESIPPITTLSQSWFVVPPASQFEGIRPETVRIVATAPGTELVYEPPDSTLPSNIGLAGEFVELPARSTAFAISANQPVLVVESMHLDNTSWGPLGGVGNFAMSVAISQESLLDDISFSEPSTLDLAWVDVVAPLTASIVLDGNVLTGMTPIGDSGHGFVRAPLSGGSGGTHRLVGDAGFGATVVGYSTATGASLWYPATP